MWIQHGMLVSELFWITSSATLSISSLTRESKSFCMFFGKELQYVKIYMLAPLERRKGQRSHFPVFIDTLVMCLGACLQCMCIYLH